MTLEIHGVLRSRATRNVWLCLEAGLPFTHLPVIQAYRLADPAAPDAPPHTRAPAFLALNPNGRIPVLVDRDGAEPLVLAESMAINLYLARKSGGSLGPTSLAEEGLMTMWSFWAMTEAEPHAIDVLFHRVVHPVAERDAARADRAVAALRQPIAVLDAALARADWLVGERFTVADLNVAEVMRYAQPAPELFDSAPNVTRWLAACQSRPAFVETMRRRSLEPV